MFGRAGDRTDFVLGTQDQGVSQMHFRVDHNWKTINLVLTNLSGNGTSWIDPETGQREIIKTSRAILGNDQYRITVGVIELTLQIPPRHEKQQAEYEANLRRLRKEVEHAIPKFGGLAIQRRGTITPMVVGRKRKFVLRRIIGAGVMASVREAVDYETGDLYAAKQCRVTNENLNSVLCKIKIMRRQKHVSSADIP